MVPSAYPLAYHSGRAKAASQEDMHPNSVLAVAAAGPKWRDVSFLH